MQNKKRTVKRAICLYKIVSIKNVYDPSSTGMKVIKHLFCTNFQKFLHANSCIGCVFYSAKRECS